MNLSEFFRQHPKVAIAFSGGVDSAYLLSAALKCGATLKAYYVKSPFQPQFELEDAKRLAQQLGADLEVIPVDVLHCNEVRSNPKDRCYHCKKVMFSHVLEAAKADGFDLILDGTNASDDLSDRPGVKALREYSVRSPLRECGLTKEEIRLLSKEAGLFTWDKPAYACLATRIPTGEEITPEKLVRTEAAEAYLSGLGLRDFRVRLMGSNAKIQVSPADLNILLEHRHDIVKKLKQSYDQVLLDLEVRNEQ